MVSRMPYDSTLFCAYHHEDKDALWLFVQFWKMDLYEFQWSSLKGGWVAYIWK